MGKSVFLLSIHVITEVLLIGFNRGKFYDNLMTPRFSRELSG